MLTGYSLKGSDQSELGCIGALAAITGSFDGIIYPSWLAFSNCHQFAEEFVW